jgi:hypothetical protein
MDEASTGMCPFFNSMTMIKLVSYPIGLGLILAGLLLQLIGVKRVGYIVELLGNRLAPEPDVMP